MRCEATEDAEAGAETHGRMIESSLPLCSLSGSAVTSSRSRGLRNPALYFHSNTLFITLPWASTSCSKTAQVPFKRARPGESVM